MPDDSKARASTAVDAKIDVTIDATINGQRVSPQQVQQWELGRARAVLPKLSRLLGQPAADDGPMGDLARLRAELLALKEQCGRERLRQTLGGRMRVSAWSTKAALALSGSRRKPCMTELTVAGVGARQVADGIDDLMRNDTAANRQANLLACPDHYLLQARGDLLEVIETAGGSPFPAQFFMRFGDESGLQTPRDPAAAGQSVGTARLADGTVIGGVRHQFYDAADGTLARLRVEFPAATPSYMIRQHQWHLACEFSHWLRVAAARAT
ncbi:MAG: hypothetical protein LCI02_24950 [Proteobacteria bacterium]|nr:hypothetical protein [Pseudomonadota bacterium]